AGDPARADRGDHGDRRLGRLAHLAAVHQPGPVRPEGRAVRPRPLVFHFHLPVPAPGAQLPVRGGLPVAAGRRGGARAVRRARLAGPAAAGATVGAQAPLFVLVGVFVLLKGVAYWVDRWGIDFSQRGAVTTGASYTDVNAVLPAKTVLAVIAVLCAVLFFAGAVRRSALLPA